MIGIVLAAVFSIMYLRLVLTDRENGGHIKKVGDATPAPAPHCSCVRMFLIRQSFAVTYRVPLHGRAMELGVFGVPWVCWLCGGWARKDTWPPLVCLVILANVSWSTVHLTEHVNS